MQAFTSLELRLRSQTRLMATRERYNAILVAVDPAQPSFDGFNKNLRDHALFLGHDFNAGSVSQIVEDVRMLTVRVAELDITLDACQEAARGYLEASALPMRIERARAKSAAPDGN